MPRNEIALSVYLRLKPEPEPLLSVAAVVYDAKQREYYLRRRGLSRAVAGTAQFFGISEETARNCFGEYRDDLLLFADLIDWG